MDIKRKPVQNGTRKYNKKDVKYCDTDKLKSCVLSTPPQRKTYRTPHKAPTARDDCDEMYNTEDASPVLLSTQEGGRGCEVIWDWHSPVRNELTPRNTRKEKIKRQNTCKSKNVSPLLHLSCKRKLQKPVNPDFLANLQAQLAEIQQKFYSNKANSSNNFSPHRNTVNNDISRIKSDTYILEDNLQNVSPAKSEVSGISDFFRDDSFTECLIQCSQAAESNITMDHQIKSDLNKNDITSKINEQNLSPELFTFDDTINFEQCETPKVKTINKLVKDNNASRKVQMNGVTTNTKCVLQTPEKKSMEYINDDSFDAILSTFSEEQFIIADDVHIENTLHNLNCDIKNTTEGSKKQMIPNHSTIPQSTTERCYEDFMKSEQSQSFRSPLSKLGFGRHNSMPVSPRILGGKVQGGHNSIGRHNSMPFNTNNKIKDHKLINILNRFDSLESLESQSLSSQCTPEEIEQKRQEALKKKEARRIRQEIERKRLEAIEKRQMKSKAQMNRNLSCNDK